MFGITRHAENQLRSRTGWTKRAVRRAVLELPEKGRRIGEIEWLFRVLRWIVIGRKVVTAYPIRGTSSDGAQEFEQFGFKRKYRAKGRRHHD